MLKTKLPHSAERGYVATLVVTLVALVVAVLLVVNRQHIIDQVSVWQYQPSSAIASLADRSGMSSTGRFYYYASHPVLESNQAFYNDCARKEQNVAILGCYDGRRIYLFNVTNPALDGIREVTAAHEMLHAAYERMSQPERDQVDGLLEAEYTKLKDNKDFADRVAFYARTEPGERDNELHSVIGTEVANISPALEAHYKQYFDNRSDVVALHDKYASVFSSLQTQSDQLSAQLKTLGDTIEKDSASYNTNVAQLNQDITAFNDRANNGGFASQAQFNSERSALTTRAQQLSDDRTVINNEVAHYNQLRDQLLQVASQSDALNRSIDSSLAPAPSV